MSAIRKHLPDFAALIGLLVVAAIVAVIILDNQRLSLPAGVTVLGRDQPDSSIARFPLKLRDRLCPALQCGEMYFP